MREKEEYKKSQFVTENFSIISNDFLKNLLLNKLNSQEYMQKFWEYTGRTDKPGNMTSADSETP